MKRRYFAKLCDNWQRYSMGSCDNNRSIVFGEDVPVDTEGDFYFQTRDDDIYM